MLPNPQVALFLACVAVAVIAEDSDERRPYSYSPQRPRYYDNSHESSSSSSSSSSEESYEDAKYDFDWKVDEGDNNFGHKESRDGDTTRGSYFVDLPDGRRQTVTYYVDAYSGYVAEVSYSRTPRYSEESSEEFYEYSARPSYRNSRRSYYY